MMPTNAIPKLSVVVVCLNNLVVLDRCLSALTAQAHTNSIEILAVGRWNQGHDNSELQKRYPSVRWITAPNESTVPQMRTCGITTSRGDIIALLEDDCVVAEQWCEQIIRAHQASYEAIGGAIEPQDGYKNLDWAVYFCEYGRFMLPFAGSVAALPGNNVSYKRNILSSVQAQDGFYDVFFHWQLQQTGKILFADPKLVLTNINHWQLSQVTAMPFHHGWAFAGMRATNFPIWRRGFYAGLTIGLPFIKTARIAQQVIGRKRYLKFFFLSIHWTLLFMLSWSMGEFMGYMFGAGKSAEQWR